MNTEVIEKQGFKIVEKLSESSHIITWKAIQHSLNRTVSLSMLKPEASGNPAEVQHFLEISRTLAKLKCPIVPSFFDVVSSGDLHYVICEYVDGVRLSDHVRENGPLTPKEALSITYALAEGLALFWGAHRIIHRNLKGENIRLDPRSVVKIMDFSLALEITPETDIKAHDGGLIVGTAQYLSPEQARGESHFSTQADMYALGILLYYMLTQKLPFDGKPVLEILSCQIREKIKPPHLLNPQVPITFSWFIHRLLMKDARDRYATWELLLEDLQKIIDWDIPSCVRPDEKNPSTLDKIGMEGTVDKKHLMKRARVVPKKIGQQGTSYPGKSLDEELQRIEKRQARFRELIFWGLLLIWLGALFLYRSTTDPDSKEKLGRIFAPLDRISENLREGDAEKITLLQEKKDHKKPAPSIGEKETPPVTAGQKPGERESEPVVDTPLTPKQKRSIAQALLDQQIERAIELIDALPETTRNRESLSNALKKLPSPELYIFRGLQKKIGLPLDITRNGVTKTVTLRSIANRTLYVERNGHALEIPLKKLEVEDFLAWIDPPVNAEDTLSYCLLLLRSEKERGRVKEFSRKAPLFTEILNRAMIIGEKR